jgi:hypothetical protein
MDLRHGIVSAAAAFALLGAARDGGAGGAAVDGVVRTAGPIGGLMGYSVRVTCGATTRSVHAAADGRFHVADVPPGRCAVTAESHFCYQWGRIAKGTLIAPATNVELIIPADAPKGGPQTAR